MECSEIETMGQDFCQNCEPDTFLKNILTFIFSCSNIIKNSGAQTVDVEIKAVDALTERPDAEKGWRCRLLNGPRRAQ